MGKPGFFYLIILLVFAGFSCKGESQDLSTCKESYRSALNRFNQFYQKADTTFLKEAIDYLDHSLRCKETRYKAINLKVSVLSLLGAYKLGYNFVDSLNVDEAGKNYKKKMYLLFFKAKQYETEVNFEQRNYLLDSASRNIQSFIASATDIDVEAYSDLYFIRALFLTRENYIAELDSLKSKYPSRQEFFEGLKNISDDQILVSPN